MERIYSKHQGEWGEKLGRVAVGDEPLLARSVDGGVLLPVRRKALTDIQSGGVYDGLFEGGVANRSFRFVAGCVRDTTKPKRNYSCVSSYKPASPVVYRDEDVVFGGILYGHFGHMLTDGLSRMWWYARNQASEKKMVFLVMPDESAEQAERLFELAGLSRDRYEVVDTPTRFRSILVPDEAIYALEGRVNVGWLEFFDLLVRRANEISSVPVREKIYLTRTHYKKRDGIGEEYYERFFEGSGYDVIAPEEFSLADQVRLISNAESIACTMGTLSHCAVFAGEGKRLTCLLRSDSTIMQQLIIDKARNLDWVFFDAHLNFLPTVQWRGAYLYGPTDGFREYLRDRSIEYDASTSTQREIVRQRAYDYMALWKETYSDAENYRAVYKSDIVSLLESLDSVVEPNMHDYGSFKAYDRLRMEFYRDQNERRLVRKAKRLLRQLGMKV